MRVKLLIPVVIFLTFLAACNKTSTPASGQQATVTLQDGTTFSGTVTASSPSSITLQASTGETRTYPMTQVSGVQYAPAQSATTQAPAGTASAPAAAPSAAPAPPPPPVTRTIPAGTRLAVRTNETIDSERAAPGQEFSGIVNRDVTDDAGNVAIPKGSDALIVVRSASGQGKFQGQSDIVVDVAAVKINGQEYRLQTSDFAERGKQGVGLNKRTGKFAGSGAALGGIIGAIAGGGKGAGIGLLAGAAAGTGTQAVTRGKAVRIPAESVLNFRLEAAVTIQQIQ